MAQKKLDMKAVFATLDEILEAELAGVVRYTQYGFMVFGYSRIPIIHWLESQATESLQHARQAGEMITHLGGRPSLGIGKTVKKPLRNIGDIMRDALEHERAAMALYRKLLGQVEGRSIVVEEYARGQIATEELHAGEIEKMLRHPDGG
ncbi:MAG: bacterioferritin [Gammaproteobacteria bacterium]|jgi:bacterioferritin|nr:bacterioferritin [Gammaproteobacteria bacterium]